MSRERDGEKIGGWLAIAILIVALATGILIFIDIDNALKHTVGFNRKSAIIEFFRQHEGPWEREVFLTYYQGGEKSALDIREGPGGEDSY